MDTESSKRWIHSRKYAAPPPAWRREDAGAIVFGDAWHDKAFTIPLVWVFSQVAYNPDVVEDYTVNFSNFGTYRYHEYTVPVYQ